MSGGVSVYGTLAGFFATVLVGTMVLFEKGGVPEMAVVVAVGFVGLNLDSVLGTLTQALYRCPACGRVTEALSHCQRPTVLTKGFAWMNNEMVNAISGVSAGLLAWALLLALR